MVNPAATCELLWGGSETMLVTRASMREPAANYEKGYYDRHVKPKELDWMVGW
jgi:hypothetical protein